MEQIIHVPANIDIATADKSEWMAVVPSGVESAFSGMFASGASFHEARKNLAHLCILALQTGAAAPDGIDPTQVTAVRIMATTRKTFEVADVGEIPAS